MLVATTSVKTSTKFDLDPIVNEPSTAKVERSIEGEDYTIYAKSSMEAFVSSDTEEQTVYVDLRINTYANVGIEESLHTFTTLMTNRFTREQAEALVAVLSHELGKL